MYFTKSVFYSCCLLLTVLVVTRCRKPETFDEALYDERYAGGLATNFSQNADAYGITLDNLSARDAFVHDVGDKAFDAAFVTAPAPIQGGLGTLYNNISCASCHHADAKGIPTFGERNSAMLMRVSNGNDPHTGPIAVEGFGKQLQNRSVLGVKPECGISIQYQELKDAFADGTPYSLYKPTYIVEDAYIPLPSTVYYSARLAPSVFGLGLLESIDDETLIRLSDEQDANQDGISGRVNWVYDAYLQKQMIGRFGLKANTATLLTQVAEAYNQDMGITSYVSPIENAYGQSQFTFYQTEPELADSMLQATVFYMRTLSVPARRDVKNSEVLRGQKLFQQLHCSACHVPTLYTGTRATLGQLSNQRIQAFTDLLLHDMGAELADNREDFLASGTEWRTPPLWGIGLLKRVNGSEIYLHDGRAKTLNEAILWHGGEAQKAKEEYKQLSLEDRNALIQFLKSL